MKNIFLSVIFLLFTIGAIAQEDTTVLRVDEVEKKRGLQKERLFTGGGITLSFSSDGTVLGASPVFGYSITNWLDLGLVVNYIYSSQRYRSANGLLTDDKLKQTNVGPGLLTRIFPVKFLFLQGQVEKNFISVKYMPSNSLFPDERYKVEANSFLVGGGYCQGRGGSGEPFYYLSLLFDIAKDKNSPYVELTETGKVRARPIFRAGIQIPLFQGRSLL